LADEEALKALLADPDVRQRILASLRASGSVPEATSTAPQRLGWFRQLPSLAWAGSIAAAGLVLIFGWQMNEDWGLLVQQEQEVERSVSEDKERDANTVVFRSQLSTVTETIEKTSGPQKKNHKEPELADPIPASTRAPQSITISKALHDTDRMRQSSAKVRSESVSRQEVTREPRLKAKKPIVSAPKSRGVPHGPEEDQFVAPSVASLEAETPFPQQLSRSFVDQVKKSNAISAPSARDIFYANTSRRADEAGIELEDKRANQLLDGMSSDERFVEEETSDLIETQESVIDFALVGSRGIRYSFFRKTSDGKNEAIDITQFSGNMAELRLTIESSVSGYLYVLTHFGKGKWQLVSPKSSNDSVLSDGAITVNPYQPVDFALSQITHAQGKAMVSSMTLLLSSIPLMTVGDWLGVEKGHAQHEGRFSEQVQGDIFVTEHMLQPPKPLKVAIHMKK